MARWTGVTCGSDGSFSIISEWDNSQAGTKGYAMSAFCLEEVTPLPENFTIIPLPDTQKYSRYYPDIYTNQTQWIVDYREALNIVYVGHEGDIVDTASSTTQWENANTSMTYLEDPVTTGLPDGIPYSVVRGNHDLSSLYEEYFGVSRFEGRSYYGGHYSDNNQNNYVLFDVGDLHFISISLDYDPDTNELAWAQSILQSYSDRRAIIVSHSILNNPAADWTTPGLNIYNAVKEYPNVFLMLCGHMHYEARRTDTYNGNTIHTLLADYQDYPNGGNGWLRIMEFSPSTNEIQVKTYSPWLDEYQTDDDSQFTLSYEMTPPEGPPTATLDSPINNSILTSSTVMLNCTCTDESNLQNVTLYLGSADQGTPGSVSVRVSASSDDAEERIDTGAVDLTSSDLELCLDAASQIVGTRFNNVEIPQGATITNAYVEFECDVGTHTGTVPLQIRGQASDNPPTFTSATNDISSRTPTTAMIQWDITEQWTVDYDYPSPDISSIIQEIIDRPGWVSGNSLVLMFNATSSNRRETESYNGESAAAPLLVVEYTEGGGWLSWHANQTKVISGTINSTNFTVNLVDGSYRWNCLVFDDNGNSAFATEDSIFTITTGPLENYTLTINIIGNGTVTPLNGTIYQEGILVDIEAIADPGWQFTSWSGDLTGTTNPTNIIMDENKTINATFTEQPNITAGAIIISGFQSWNSPDGQNPGAVSYTHLTLPTN